MANKNRISKVTTRTGDGGNTKLATGRTIGKHDPLVRVIGSVDELNSQIGVLTAVVDGGHQTQLKTIQQALFDMGAVFAMEGNYEPPLPSGLEGITEELNQQLPPLTEFVLPGGGVAAAQSHICRAVCRRAETDLWQVIHALTDAPKAYTGAAQYLNRLSDYFFVLARSLTVTDEEQWQGPDRG
jgi:cob(I)alamin adenosyltransferase